MKRPTKSLKDVQSNENIAKIIAESNSYQFKAFGTRIAYYHLKLLWSKNKKAI